MGNKRSKRLVRKLIKLDKRKMSDKPQNKAACDSAYTELTYKITTEENKPGNANNGNQPFRDWLKANIKPPYDKPYLIKTDYYSICEDTRKRMFNIEKKKMNEFSFLLNSSIWIRLCGENDDIMVVGSKAEIAANEFNWFKRLGLYDFNAAKEYIEYESRIQQHNYLDESIGGHGILVTPMIYSNEEEYRDFFIGEKSDIVFKFLEGTGESKGFQTEKVALRILLVDDKIGNVQNENNSMIRKCHDEENKDGKRRCKECNYPQDNNEKEEPCKLQVIKKLLSGDFISKDKKCDKRVKYNEKTYWVDDIHSYCVDAIHIKDLWETKEKNGNGIFTLELIKSKVQQINKDLEPEVKKDGKDLSYVQIIGVRDLESALVLMNCCKFDIILLDYLLGKRTDNQTERVYSTELFEFLSYKFDSEDLKKCPNIIKMLANNTPVTDDKEKLKFLEQFRDEVKLNRGPLDKYWIVPMTSYNPSFLADLQRRNVRLIDHRWNINQGADPINTPWRFLHKLNEFIDLQLRSSVFWKSQLLTFIQYTGEDLENRIKNTLKEKTTDSCFVEFQQFMGAEYANFMKRYGSRKLIERDAATDVDNSSKSLFSTYISKKFYNEAQYCVENELNRMLQNFYHRSATMFDDQYDYQRLREVFEQMRVFIAYNKLEDSLKDEDKKKLLHGLRFLHTIIDSEFRCEKIDKWLKENAQ